MLWGVYSNYEADGKGPSLVAAGVEVPPGSAAASGLSLVTIAPGPYLVFTFKGAVPKVVIDGWKEVGTFLIDHLDIKRAYKTDFELYKSAQEVEIHLSIKEEKGA